ncbi:DMT family transporter [Nonomuraea longicatena]|uniref:DMT family transporter n=1 Tax=Nonomuraea longicatena TaxID=83682 RepID=A0ABP4BN97_9ACTN
MRIAVIGAAVLWGTAGTAGLLVSADSVALAAARLVVGGAALAALAGPRLRGGLTPSLLLGAVAVAAYQLCFFAAVSRTGVAIGTVVAIGSGPVFTGILAWALHGERPSGRWVIATVAAVAGCAALIVGGGAQAGGQVVSGVLLALLGGLLYAFYAVVAARAIGRGVPSDVAMGAMFGGAAIVMVPVLVWRGAEWMVTPGALVAVLYLGLGTTALAYFLYGRGLRSTPVTTAATLALAEPGVAALLGVVVLGERLTGLSVAGLLLLLAALSALALPARPRGLLRSLRSRVSRGFLRSRGSRGSLEPAVTAKPPSPPPAAARSRPPG